MTPERLTAIAARLDDLEQQRIEVLVELGDELLASGYVSGSWMRDGSSIGSDSASVLEADGAGATGEATVELSASPASAPIEQATPDGSPGSGSARRRQPTISPASPGIAFDPLGPALTCPECGWETAFPAGLGSHRKRKHGVKGTSQGAKDWAAKHPPTAATNGAPAPVLRTHAAEPDRAPDPRFHRPTIAERVAARDASRAHEAAKRARRLGRTVGGGA